jgi:hypothetical protein
MPQLTLDIIQTPENAFAPSYLELAAFLFPTQRSSFDTFMKEM